MFSPIVPRGEWVATYPTTNGRTILGMRLAALYVVIGLALVVARAAWSFDLGSWGIELYIVIGVFIAAMLAISFGQFWAKRATVRPELQPTMSEARTGEYAAPARLASGVVPVTPAIDLRRRPAADPGDTIEGVEPDRNEAGPDDDR